MQPLRILHVTPYLPEAWAYGGIPRLTSTLTRELARRGHEVTICATDVCDSTRRLSGGSLTSPPGVTWRVFPNISNHLAYRWQFFTPMGLGRYLRAQAKGFDVAHLHACRNLPGTIAGHHLRRAGVPYLVAPNGTAPIIERSRTAKRVFDAMSGRRLLRRAAGVLAVSAAESRQLETLGVPTTSIYRVPNPVDLDEFATPPVAGEFRRHLNLPREPLIVFLGQLTPRKRVDVLIAAFARLERRDARLVVAGNDGGDEPRLRAIASTLGLSDRVTFVGLLEGPARLQALADADLVVYASEHEVFGLVPLEALLAGTPVIVGDDSGCGEVIRAVGGGRLVPPGRADALGAAMSEMLANGDRWRRAAADAAVRVRSEFGAVSVGAQLSDVYQAIANRS